MADPSPLPAGLSSRPWMQKPVLLGLVLLAAVAVGTTCCSSRRSRPSSKAAGQGPGTGSGQPQGREGPAAAQVQLAPVVASYGTTGVVSAPVPGTSGRSAGPDAWFVAMVDLDAKKPLHHIRLVEVQLLGKDGQVVASAVPPFRVRAAPPTRSTRDFSAHGTLPFAGKVRSGESVRLWLHAPLDHPFSVINGRQPVRFRAEFSADGPARFHVQGVLDRPWPTAGPGR